MVRSTCSIFRSSSHQLFCYALLTGVAVGSIGCSGSVTGSGSTPSTPAAISVSVSGSADTRLGTTTQFTATVTNSSNTNVTWQVNGITGGSTTSGTISASGLYTAPAALPSQNPVTISAISQASTSVSGTFSEAIWNPIPVVSTISATESGTSTSFLIDVRGSSFVQGAAIQVAGTALPTTFISATELQANYVAPGTGSALITVTNPNPGSAASASSNVLFSVGISVTVSGAADTRLGTTTQFTATVANSSNSNVTWQVNGITGGSTTTGTISASGLYTAPAALPSQNPVTISAISQASTSVSGTLSEAIWNPIPVVSTVSATESGTSTSFLIDVRGSSFVQGAAIQVAGTALPTTFISATELQANYVAPGTSSALITVANPNPGSAASASSNVLFTIYKAAVPAAARLLDQTSFGPTLASIQHVQTIGLDAYITEQINTAPTLLPDITNPPPTICATNIVPCEQSEWWQTVLTGNDQLRQRVAFALSEMMVISTNAESAAAIIPYQNFLAKDAFGNFATVMRDVTLSTGMGLYLNMLNSYKPGNGQIANENYSRENMQLFTIGLNLINQDGTPQLDSSGNLIPTFTEAQVQAFARAYTGWTYATATGGVPTKYPNTTPNYDSPMVALDSAHDMTPKILLNGTTLPANQSAELDLEGALANLFAHPNVGPFVCRQLIQHLVSSNPSPAYVARIAAVFANNGNGVRGDLGAVVRAILEDTEARAGDTDPTSNGGHLREPILYLANVIRALGFVNTDPTGYYGTLSNYSGNLSEKPYASGSVFNFFPPSYIIPDSTNNAPEFALENTASAILRLTQANSLVYNQISGFSVDLSATSAWGLMAANPGNLVDSLGAIFMHGQMPANMRTAIVNHITTLTDMGQRVRVATYLVITSSQYKIEH